MSTDKAPPIQSTPMTSPDETAQAFRVLSAEGVQGTSPKDVSYYMRSPRAAVANIEQMLRSGSDPTVDPDRARILAVLRPHVRWLDANPAEDPQMADARQLPTSVIKEALRERRAAEEQLRADEKKARQHSRKKKAGYWKPLTGEDKQAILAAVETTKGVPFRDTPGRKATYPSLNKAKTNYVDVPVVVLADYKGGHIVRLTESTSTILPPDWPLTFVTDEEWAHALADFESAQEVA